MTREVKVRPKYNEVDYGEKLGHIIRFINQGNQVKVTVMFRGREAVRPELGEALLRRFAEDLKDITNPGASTVRDGRAIYIVFTPKA